MKLLNILLLTVCFFATQIFNAYAQQGVSGLSDTLEKKFEYYRLKKQEGVLYAHFDKTVYTNNENVWFTAYLLSSAPNAKNDVLSAILVKDDDHSIALEEKFVMARGISTGNMFLPDSIASGDYSFILFTNEVSNGKPANLFIQPVTVKNTAEVSFSARLDVIDTVASPARGKRKVRLVTNAKGVKIISDAQVNYYVGDKLHPVASGKVKTDRAGQYIFDVPANALSLNNNLMVVQVISGKESETVKLPLPVSTNLPVVRFYPEGGNLTDGVLNMIGWEVKNTIDNPYKVKGILYKDDHPIDTISTNSYGMGRFRLVPEIKSRYYVRLLLAGLKDSTYKLPAIFDGRPVISIMNAVTDDTLNMVIKAKQSQNVYVIVHNYKNLFYTFPVQINSAGRPVKVLLKTLPKGIAEVTILDTLQRPCAERLFFAHYNQRGTVEITTDKSEYKTRQPITLKLDLQDYNGTPVKGLVSIACIQANRSEIKKATDIESYVYLNNDLGRLPLKDDYMGNSADDRAYLEDVLLIKGWRRYTWPEFAAATGKDTVKLPDSLIFKGHVRHFGKPLKKPFDIFIMRDSALNTVQTDITGNFRLNNADLYNTENKNIHLLASGNNPESYQITLDDPYQKVDRAAAINYQPVNYHHVVPMQQANSRDELTRLEHVIRLKEVKITGGNDNSLYAANACGDYVCFHNILNCPNHRHDPRNRPALAGETYYVYNPAFLELSPVVYNGCVPGAYKSSEAFKGINYPVEFYISNYQQYNPSEPEYLSTIYWKNLYAVSPANSMTLKFYTSDITGDFKIVVQGVCGNDVIYGEKYFNVSKP